MSNKPNKLTPDLIGSSINVVSPSHTAKDLGRRSGPSAGMAMVMPVSEIDFFDRNPRRIHDPEAFELLKSSIREVGVQQPVHITTPPGSSRYMLARGGNSRLLCLKELLAETGDERYARIPAIYVEYSSEEDMLIDHLIENEQRADMVFWDKACAYAEARDAFQKAAPSPLGLRPLADKFAQKGLKVYFTKLSVYLFAADNLSALGNLCHYLSIPKVNELRKTFQNLQSVSKNTETEDGTFAEFWESALENWTNVDADAQDIDIEALGRHLEHLFEDTFGIAPKAKPANRPSDDGAANNSHGATGLSGHAPASEPGEARKQHSETAPASPAPLPGNTGGNTTNGGARGDSLTRQPVDPADGALISGALPASAASDTPSRPAATEVQTAVAVPRTREQIVADIRSAVKKLAASVHIESLLISDDRMPYGWMLDFPDFSKPGWQGTDEHTAMINVRHNLAATVFLYLWTVSGEKALWDNPQLLKHYNPFTNKPHSVIHSIYPDDNLRQEAETFGIGMDAYSASVVEVMFELILTDDEARQAYTDHIRHTAELEKMGADNWSLYQEQ